MKTIRFFLMAALGFAVLGPATAEAGCRTRVTRDYCGNVLYWEYAFVGRGWMGVRGMTGWWCGASVRRRGRCIVRRSVMVAGITGDRAVGWRGVMMAGTGAAGIAGAGVVGLRVRGAGVDSGRRTAERPGAMSASGRFVKWEREGSGYFFRMNSASMSWSPMVPELSVL
jgi:hypothetical protein